jgi:membrane-associated phospholipid phosphatase
MPSGHALKAFATMTVVVKRYPHWWVQLPAYSIACGVAVQRIDSRNHWVSDVVLGGTIGR